MSKKEDRTLKIIISTLMILAGGFASFAVKIEVVSWLLVGISFLIFGTALFVVFYRGRTLGLGKIAQESDLDSNIPYKICQSGKVTGRTVFYLEPSLEYETEIVMEPRGGFKKFEILDDQYLVPKKLKAKVVNGSLWTPV